MSIQTTSIIGDDGKPLPPDQVAVSRLKKSHAAMEQKVVELEKRVADLEAKQREAERQAARGARF
jgi:hypothetical protein